MKKSYAERSALLLCMQELDELYRKQVHRSVKVAAYKKQQKKQMNIAAYMQYGGGVLINLFCDK